MASAFPEMTSAELAEVPKIQRKLDAYGGYAADDAEDGDLPSDNEGSEDDEPEG